MSKNEIKNITRTRRVVYLRLDEKQYEQLTKDAAVRGIKVQQLLKSVYFDGSKSLPIMPKEKCNLILSELKRIGNNVNQIARKVNSGFGRGWSTSLDQAVAEISKLRKGLVSYVAS